MTREVEYDGLAHLASVCHALLVIEEAVKTVGHVEEVAVLLAARFAVARGYADVAACLHEVEVVGVHGGQITRESFQRSAEHAGYQVDHECERYDSENEFLNLDVRLLAIVREAELAEQVEAEHREYHYPKGYVDFAVENAPMVGLVGYGEELETESQLNETEHYLDRVEPSAGLGQVLEQRGEEREEGERKRESRREYEHGDDRLPYGSLRRLHEDGAYDGTGT